MSAKFVEKSSNAKVADKKTKVSATYAPIEGTCPDTCSLKEKGCYAQVSYVAIINRKLETSAKRKKLSAVSLAKEEAKAIDNSFNGKEVTVSFLRLHVSGDSRTIRGTRLINAAIKRWKERGGKTAWSYTHAWRSVPRSEWSEVSILASVKNVSEAKKAREQGYAPAIVVDSFQDKKAFTIPGSDISFIPCPAQTHDDIACVNCKLCMNADRLFRDNMGIAFAAHGATASTIKRHLNVLK